ncbi:MAG: hypothetical protein AMXMBFR84_05230 [Candidatus Hydrogenedentota bacterium]
MKPVRLGASLGVFVVCLAAWGETPRYTVEQASSYMRDWLLLGPFPVAESDQATDQTLHIPSFHADTLASIGGEAHAQISEGGVVEAGGVSRTWALHRSASDLIDLDKAISTDSLVFGYAYCEIESQDERTVVLAAGSNDDGRMWLNGVEVISDLGPHGHRFDGVLAPVRLKKGRNTLLVKAMDRAGFWQFSARILPILDPAVLPRISVFRCVTDSDGVARLRVLPIVPAASDAVASAKLQVYRSKDPDVVLWAGAWEPGPDFALPLDPKRYDELMLRVDAEFAGGGVHSTEIPFTVGIRREYRLFADGVSDYAIEITADATESETWAAEELQHWIREASSVEIPVLEPGAPWSDARIVIGHAGRDPQDESFRYFNVGPSIFVEGGSERGAMYGVFSFLERELGCRWYTPRVSAVPKKASYTFHYLDHAEAPGVTVRNDFYFEAFEPIWAARNRINGAMGYREQPGGVESYWGVHTFYPLMPPSEFFDSHPEYYSLIDGKRQHDHAQLCLTNPDVLRILTERLRQRMRENPEYLIYCVSQNDWRNPCQCEKCSAIVEREGSEAGPMVEFVNAVAEAVEAEFPDKYIGTLAYQYTRKPPKTVKPRKNVVIRLCSIECCFSHPMTECPENQSFVEDIRGWAAIAPKIYIWDYVVNFSHYVMPYPNFPVLQPNIQFLREHHAIGIMEQAAYQSRGGEFAELRMYVIAKLLWNPDCDVNAAIDDFMYGYYGRAGQYVRAYFDLLHGQVTPERHITLGLRPDDPLFSDAFVRKAGWLFDQAEAIADNEEIRQRVEMARLPVLYLKCKRMPLEAKQDGSFARFKAIAEREGVTHLAEAGEPHRLAFYAEMDAAQ